MTTAELAVFYATESKILRRKVIPDSVGQLRQLAIFPGESVLWMPFDQPHDDAACRAAISAASGVVPPSGRCCVVSEAGCVVAICNADPASDVHPLGQLTPSENAGLGDHYVDGVFLDQSAASINLAITVIETVSGAVST